MGLPGIAQKYTRISGVDYKPGDPIPAEAMSRRVAELNLATYAPEAAVAGLRAGTAATVGAFDPGEHKVDVVLAYLDEHPDQLERILAAELNGRARKGLLAELEARADESDTDESDAEASGHDGITAGESSSQT